MPQLRVRFQSAVTYLRRTSIVNFAQTFIALICVTPLLVGIVLTLIGRPPWQSTGSGLAGYHPKAPPASFDWWNRSLQMTAMTMVDERLPLRSWMVRINNQLDYWLLRYSRMYDGNIIIGRNGVLFEKAYIRQAFGHAAAVPDATIRRAGEGIKKLQRVLAERGIFLVVVGTPGKVSLMRESVPSVFSDYHPEAPRNYDRLLRIFSELGVPLFDGRAALLQTKIAARGPLFPRGGTHWTLLGAYAAIEHPIAQMLAEMTPFGGRKLVLDDVSISRRAAGTDADLLILLNLAIPDRSYGTVQVQTHLEGAPLPKAIVIVGSSFSDQIQSILMRSGIAPRVVSFMYMKYLLTGLPDAAFEKLPPTWPQIVLNETSAVIIELNETAFFESINESYVDVLVEGLVSRPENYR